MTDIQDARLENMIREYGREVGSFEMARWKSRAKAQEWFFKERGLA